MNNPQQTISALLGPIPKFDAIPACAGESDLFDSIDPRDTALSSEICRNCPAYQQCSDWAEAQPLNSLHGFIGGSVYEWVSHESLRRKRSLILPVVVT